MLNDWVDRIDSRTIKRDQFHWLDFPCCHLDQKFACIAFRWVAISLGKKGFIENHKKISFQVSGEQSGPSGRTVRGLLVFILIPEFWAKVLEKIRFRADCPWTHGGRSVILYRTGCCSGGRADGPWPASGQSAWPRRTVRPAQRSAPPAVDSAFLPLEFKRGQSARYAFCP
jgi:hypothetical protein